MVATDSVSVAIFFCEVDGTKGHTGVWYGACYICGVGQGLESNIGQGPSCRASNPNLSKQIRSKFFIAKILYINSRWSLTLQRRSIIATARPDSLIAFFVVVKLKSDRRTILPAHPPTSYRRYSAREILYG
jgi:hypothetical protein